MADFLDKDPELRGQHFALLSFLWPEDAMKRRDALAVEMFVAELSADLRAVADAFAARSPEDRDAMRAIRARYEPLFDPERVGDALKAFCATRKEDIDARLRATQPQLAGRPIAAGIKVRGAFATFEEAELRARTLRRLDPYFDIFVSEMGAWCPWAPGIAADGGAEYAEAQLNDLMKAYKTNAIMKEQFFEERKREAQRDAIEAQMAASEAQRAAASAPPAPASASAPDVPGVAEEEEEEAGAAAARMAGGDDPWLEFKKE